MAGRHIPLEHAALAWSLPLQYWPPGEGGGRVQERRLEWEHMGEQEDQEDQGDQPPDCWHREEHVWDCSPSLGQYTPFREGEGLLHTCILRSESSCSFF